ncbi:MAG: exodeoxyribonuclease VII small subunit [Planctomycetaceae bacterium]
MAKKKSKPDSPSGEDSEITVEAAMSELSDIVGLLESGQAPLEESLQQFERGMKLLRRCHAILDAAAGANRTGDSPDRRRLRRNDRL